MPFAILAHDRPDAGSLRADNRPEHLEHLDRCQRMHWLRSRAGRRVLYGGIGEVRLAGLRHLLVALPALILELNMLDRDSVRVGIEVG